MAEYTVKAIASHIGGEVSGNADQVIKGVADLRSAQKEHMTFLGDRKYLAQAKQTKAGALLVAKGSESQDFPCPLVLVENPSRLFTEVAKLFAPEPMAWEPGVHPTAVIGKGVTLGAQVHIGPYVVIEPGVCIGARSIIGAGGYIGKESSLGEGCFLYPHVTLREETKLGCRVILHSGVVLGADGFGYEQVGGQHIKVPQMGYVQIDDDVEIGANTTIDRGRFGPTWIKEGVKIDNQVQIGHNCVIGKHAIIVAHCGIAGSTLIGDGAILAAKVGVSGHLEIGNRAIITAMSGISKDVPEGSVYSGRRAIPKKQDLQNEANINKISDLIERVKALEKAYA